MSRVQDAQERRCTWMALCRGAQDVRERLFDKLYGQNMLRM